MQDIEIFVRDLNLCWFEGRYDDLEEYFSKDTVLLPPSSDEPTIGREQIIDGYKQFGAMAKIHNFEVLDTKLFASSGLTVCHLHFRIDYEIDSARNQEEGVDVYVVNTSDGRPQVVWRTQVASA